MYVQRIYLMKYIAKKKKEKTILHDYYFYSHDNDQNALYFQSSMYVVPALFYSCNLVIFLLLIIQNGKFWNPSPLY